MGLLGELLRDPAAFILLVVPLLYSVVLHELAHGWVADKMGDPTAKMLGRLTLNPLKHLDPLGTLMLFLVGFGWAKPVPVNYNNLRHSERGLLWVSAAGIVTNIILAFVALFLLKFFSLSLESPIGKVLFITGRINIILASLNLIPIPPLDGSKILMEFLPRQMQYSMSRIEPYGFIILVALLFLDVLDPVILFISRVLLSVINLLV